MFGLSLIKNNKFSKESLKDPKKNKMMTNENLIAYMI